MNVPAGMVLNAGPPDPGVASGPEGVVADGAGEADTVCCGDKAEHATRHSGGRVPTKERR